MRIINQSRLGEKLDEFEAREVRRLLVGHYEIRYETQQPPAKAGGLALRTKSPDTGRKTRFYPAINNFHNAL